MTKILKSTGAKGSNKDPYIESEKGLEYYDSAIAGFFKPLNYIYAHGKLETDLDTDLINLYCFPDTMGELKNGYIAYYNRIDESGKIETKPVKFYLYNHRRNGQLTGICVYSDDLEARRYGENIVKNKPYNF